MLYHSGDDMTKASLEEEYHGGDGDGNAIVKAKVNAYDAAFEQIDRFVVKGKDIDELASLEHFCSESSQEKVVDGIKGYIAAFSSTSMSDEVLVAHIEKDEHYKRLLQYEEVVCVAVNLS